MASHPALARMSLTRKQTLLVPLSATQSRLCGFPVEWLHTVIPAAHT